jgi:hypothetical protein
MAEQEFEYLDKTGYPSKTGLFRLSSPIMLSIHQRRDLSSESERGQSLLHLAAQKICGPRHCLSP